MSDVVSAAEMGDVQVRLIDDLRALIADLGKNGGLISPSIYDTAQGLRLNPPAEVEPVIEWLIGEQEADGGWGNPHAPRARDIPTVAALLALCEYGDRYGTREAVEAGIAFMQKHSAIWEEGLTEDIPVAAEVLMPVLLKEAAAAGLALPAERYSELVRLGEYKRAQIAKLKPGAGTPPTFSWEAWGTGADLRVVDALGSVGHNPTATMTWLRAAEAEGISTELEEKIQQYLADASWATQTGVPGIYPTAWPINRFEQTYSLYAMIVADLFDHSALHEVVQAQVDDVARGIRPTGLGYTDYFIPDGDDTAAAVALLQVGGRKPERSILSWFERDDHFSTYPHELQFSLTVTARCAHALGLMHEDASRWQRFLARQQQPDGLWKGDKWNTSWLYTTCHVVLALRNSNERLAFRQAYNGLLEYQHRDGGWGAGSASNMTETAYAILALYTLIQEGFADEISLSALRRAHRWLLDQYLATPEGRDRCWLNKELYRPHRVDQAFILSALLCVSHLPSLVESLESPGVGSQKLSL